MHCSVNDNHLIKFSHTAWEMGGGEGEENLLVICCMILES